MDLKDIFWAIVFTMLWLEVAGWIIHNEISKTNDKLDSVIKLLREKQNND